VNIAGLSPRRHDPPIGWDREVFERLTDALAAALVAAHRRAVEKPETYAVRLAVTEPLQHKEDPR
jgi:hypothetical protein